MNECQCTAEELREVGGADHEDISAILNGTEEDVAYLRLVCHKVLEARRRGDIHAERNALGADYRWEKRGRTVGPMLYIATTINKSLGRQAPRRNINRATIRELRRTLRVRRRRR